MSNEKLERLRAKWLLREEKRKKEERNKRARKKRLELSKIKKIEKKEENKLKKKENNQLKKETEKELIKKKREERKKEREIEQERLKEEKAEKKRQKLELKQLKLLEIKKEKERKKNEKEKLKREKELEIKKEKERKREKIRREKAKIREREKEKILNIERKKAKKIRDKINEKLKKRREKEREKEKLKQDKIKQRKEERKRKKLEAKKLKIAERLKIKREKERAIRQAKLFEEKKRIKFEREKERGYYLIVTASQNRLTKTLTKTLYLEKAFQKFNEIYENLNTNIRFPKRVKNTNYQIVNCKDELMIIKRRSEMEKDDEALLKNEMGQYVRHIILDGGRYIILEKKEYQIEETFFVFGYHQYYQRKNFNFILNELILNHPDEFKQIICYRNKLIIEYDNDIAIIICKTIDEVYRLYCELMEDCKNNKKIIFKGVIALGSSIEMIMRHRIMEKTGWNETKVMRITTRP